MSKRILIAEDDYSSREALTKLAMAAGFDVIAVADGAELLAIADIGKFDVIITDLTMPNINGTSAIEILKLKGDKTPVIAITGLSSCDTYNLSDESTMIFYKPINAIELFKYIKTLCE